MNNYVVALAIACNKGESHYAMEALISR